MTVVLTPQVQNYQNYRDFLGDWFNAAKASNCKVSFRFVARQLGLRSPNHFHLVVNKQRHLSKRTLLRLHRMLRLRPKERAYLDLLHEQETTRNNPIKENITARLKRVQAELCELHTPFENFALLANSLAWYMKMGALRFHGRSLLEITKLVETSCPFQVRETDVTAALELLCRLNAVHITDGMYMFELDNLKTEWDFDDKQIKQFHHNNLLLAQSTIPWPIEKRFFSNVTIPCDAELVDTIKGEIRDLCLRLLERSNSRIKTESDCERVMSLQFALFPYFDFAQKADGAFASATN